ncbi:copper-binding protein [Ramlibacter sp.]|uniref:copper-binding protein n=1 Tax=Ramlibacter sp. TaxID=1917967 RepID=UPI002D4B9778|nr:copper-binding protein [Ramlibacter sp.]HYD75312.1 copper-binding protein [Ramlibacter sp.]
MKKFIHLVSALLLVATAGAYAQGMSMPMQPAASAGSKAAMPLVNGEIRKLDAKTGLIVLKHGEIANLGMPPMTMGFDVADKSMLKGLKVGQKVKFQAEIVSGKATVTELHPTR